MTESSQFSELIALVKSNDRNLDFGFLRSSVYSQPLTAEEQRAFLQLVDIARDQQTEAPIYEPLYQRLLHLYVLNGSRLDALSRLDRRIRGLTDGQAALVLVAGSAGIGKTSLVKAFQERIDRLGAEFVVIRSSEQSSVPYALWRDFVVAAAAKFGAKLDELPAPIGNGRVAASAHHLVEELAVWLGKSTASRPMVVLLDDLHWADADSLEVLNDLTSREQTPQILFIGTYRSEERNAGHPFYDYWPKLQRNRVFDHLHLKPLTQDDVQRLATSYQGPSSAQLAAYLYNRAEGHPLFTIELLNNLAEQGLLVQNSDGYWFPPEASVPFPTILRQLISQRVRRLGANVENLLMVAAVAGESWHLEIVEPLLDLSEEELLAALEKALAADLLLAEDGRAEAYRFSHGLVREVLYNKQLARRRKQLHERIAVQYETKQDANIYPIAYHYYEAEVWEKAYQYCTEAGEQAANSFANQRSLDLYKKALEAAQQAGEAIALHKRLDAYERLGSAYQVLDQLHEAEITYGRMRDDAQHREDLDAEVRALVHLSLVRISLYELDKAEKTAQEALTLGEQVDDPRLLAQIHGSLAKLHIVRGQLDKTGLHAQKILKQANQVDQVTQSGAYRQQAYRALFMGQYREAKRFAQQSLVNAQGTGVPLYIAGGHQILSFVQIECGEYRQAYENMRSILDVNEMSEPYYHQLSRLLNQMGYLYSELGDFSQALQWDSRAAEAGFSPQGVSNYEMQRYSLLNVAADLLQLGRIKEAWEVVSRFEAVKEAQDYAYFRYHNRYLLLLAEIHLAQDADGQAAYNQATDLAREARIFAQTYGSPKNIARSHWLEGRASLGTGKPADAVRNLDEAKRVVDAIQHGSLRWKIRLDLAEALIQSGKSPDTIVQEARVMMDQTAQSLLGSSLYNSFISSSWMARIESLEQAPVREKAAYPAGLTQREVEVLRLVAGGATNQQVADRLHISVRTVNTHMSNILNKTSCDNRTAASAFAIQNNLLST